MKKTSTNSLRKITNTNKYKSWVICMLLILVAGIQSAKAQNCSGSWSTNNPLSFFCIANGNWVGSTNASADPAGCPSTPTYTAAQQATFTFASPVSSFRIDFTAFSSNAAGCAKLEVKINGVHYNLTGSNLISGACPLSEATTDANGYIHSGSSPATNGSGTIEITGVNATTVTVATNDPVGTIFSTPYSCSTFICNAGTTAPTLSATTKANVCPATTVDLTTITASNLPGGTTLTWHTATPATTANKVATPSSVAAGTYYAAFFDATNNCYSGTSGNGSATTVVTATTTTCAALTANNPTTQTVPGGQVYTGNAGTELAPTGGTSPYTYSNGSSDPACVNPGGGAVALPPASNLTVTNSSTGAYTYTAPTVAGTYFFCIKVCDSTSPTPSCVVKTYTVVVPCAAGSNPPVLIKN